MAYASLSFARNPARSRHRSRLSRAALAASVSAASLIALVSQHAAAQQTLPGTQVLQGGRWTGARMPTVAQGNEGLVMTIKQLEKRALLDWSRFDIAKGETVHFDQESTEWIALNRIFDSKPSEIAGTITAKGQVWLQNTNGIIFREGAKVNAHTILATALPITEQQLNLGLLSGNGIIRGTTPDPLFDDFGGVTRALVPRPVDGLDPSVLLQVSSQQVSGTNVTPLDMLAAAAIRMAVLRANGMKDVATHEYSYGLHLLGKMVERKFSSNGLIDVMEQAVAGVDVSQLGNYDYQSFISTGNFFQGGIATSLPTTLRDAVAADIKAKFVDNYGALLAKGKQDYSRYIANARIVVDRGATLTAASSDSATPGKIMLFGPNVSNAGRLEAHDGQVLMTAGEQIKLSAGQAFTNSARGGLTAAVMAVAPMDSYGNYPGEPGCCTDRLRELWTTDYMNRANEVGMTVTNTGTIASDRGAVTMIGGNIAQMGSIFVTNGVRQRTGNIVLQASHGFVISDYSIGGNYFAGSLTLGEGSITSITPDMSSLTGLAADTFAPGKILLAGKDILLDRNSQVISRGGDVTIHANPNGTGARGGTSPAADETNQETRGQDGSFTMRSGAKIDVSGLRDVERNVADNIFAVEIRANEVSASPRQRDGILIGKTVYVDRRIGSSLVDWTGALGGEQRTAAQMSTAGGKVQIRASKFAVVEDGAVIDVSGGSTKYLGGTVKTTRLQDVSNRIHDISTANSNISYRGLYEETRYENGYIEGADAGAVEILSGSSRMFGKLKGDVVVGERQQLASIGQIKAPLMPAGAINAEKVKLPGLPKAGEAVLARGGPEYAAWASTYMFIMADKNAFTGTLWNETSSNSNIWEDTTLLLDPMLIGIDRKNYAGDQPELMGFIAADFFSGMGDVSLSFGGSHQTQTVNPGAKIALLPGGSFQLAGESGIQTIGDNVSIIAPSGNIGFSSGSGSTIGRNVFLSVAAPWVNDADAPAGTSLGHVNGGTIDLNGVKLTGPIRLDAAGGGWYKRLSPPSRTEPGEFLLVSGKGGEIQLGGNGMSILELLDLADMDLAGLGGGGKLRLAGTGNLVIGPRGGRATGDAEFLPDDFMKEIGAGGLTLAADTLTVQAGAHLLFQQRNLMFDGNPLSIATGTRLSDVADLVLLPDHQRTGGSLNLIGAAGVTVEKGAIVEVDALGTLSLANEQGDGTGFIDIGGTLRAHGGGISVSGNNVRIGSTAFLDASGIVQTVKSPGGHDGRTFRYDGRIVAGGSVGVDGQNVIMDAGSRIDVSGTSGLLTVYQPGRYGAVLTNALIGSDGGTISLAGSAGYILSSLRGEGGTIHNYAGKLMLGGGLMGELLLPGETDWSTGRYGLESLLANLQYIFYPEPSEEEPTSLRAILESAPDLERVLGFTAAEMEDIQITDVAEFTEFVRGAFSPLVEKTPDDLKGALILDPTMAALPNLPPPPRPFVAPEGYSPSSQPAFEKAMRFVLEILVGGPQLSTLSRGSKMHIGAAPLNDMKRFDTAGIGGNIEATRNVTVESRRVLDINGIITGGVDMTFRSRNISLNGVLAPGQTLADPVGGTLTISADTIDLGRFNVGGFKKVLIEAQGDMRGGFLPIGVIDPTRIPGVETNGALVLRAAQIYPTTDGTLRFVSTDSIRIEQTGRREAPLSAGGLLTFEAPLIQQAGTLRAPFGEIRLTATGITTTDADTGVVTTTPGRVELLSGSITSTAADGRNILYGTTFDGQSWYRPRRDEMTAELSTPPEKRVSLSGDIIEVRNGAVIDVSGSGDVLGIEFVQGPLGQTDVLAGEGIYAVVPAYGAAINAPIDPMYNPVNEQGQPAIGIGQAVWLNAFDGNAAGWYTLLPAKYALTPGGYRLTIAGEYGPGTVETQAMGDGAFAVLGHRGILGTDIADQVQSTFRLERGADVRKRSEYFETSGNSFFSSERFLEGLRRSGGVYNDDPRLPIDGGFLTLAANRSLELDGEIRAAGLSSIKDSRGGVVDITSDNIVIAAPGTDVSDLAGYLVLDPSKLSNIAESLLIGGIRRQGAGGIEIVTGQTTRSEGETIRSPEKSVGAENVVIRSSAANPLTGTELLFAANESVRVDSGAVVRAVGDGTDGADIAVAPSMPAFKHPWDSSQNMPAQDQGGAVLRVSNLGDIRISRSNVVATTGDMIVSPGATVIADDAILFDATNTTLLGAGANVRAGAITAAAGAVSFGAAPDGVSGLVISGGTLEGLGQAKKLTLKSYSTFDFYGDVALSLTGAAVFDGGGFVGRGQTPSNVAIRSGTIELRNSDSGTVTASGNGGRITFAADTMEIGEGNKLFAFGGTDIMATGRVIFDGLGKDSFDGSLKIAAAEVTGRSGAGHQVVAAGRMEISGNSAAPGLPALVTAGALLDFAGTSIDISGRIRAGSGTIRATATTGDVSLLSGARIDVAGADVSFFEVQGFLPGGGVQLNAAAGNVLIANGSTIDISGGLAGGDAGSLMLSAGHGIASLDGVLLARVATGYRGGAFGLTTSTLADFGALNGLLNQSGFSRSRDFAIIDGDVTLNGTTRVDALRIVTGTGDITVASDAVLASDSAKGGTILLASGGDLTIADGATFDVSAKGVNARGGSIDIQAGQNGSINAGAALFKVGGNGTGEGGVVRLRAAQIGNDVGITRWGAAVSGGKTRLEAFRVYDLADADGNAANGHLAEIDTALQTQVIGDAAAFMTANADAIRARLGQVGNGDFLIVPGIELRSQGDLDLVHHWNLAGSRFGGEGGVLTLRAGGDLLINANLSDGFINATFTPDVVYPYGWNRNGGEPLPDGPEQDFTNDRSWSYNLIGGADFAQTNILATRGDGVGNIEVGGLVRTGTGTIAVAAAGDLNYEKAPLIRYVADFNAATTITIPAGTAMADGTVLKPTIYASYIPDQVLNDPVVAAGTTFPAGTTLPAGTVLPDGRVLYWDQAIMEAVTFTTETTLTGTVRVPQPPAATTRYPSLPAGTVLRKGTKVPSGTEMPDGTILGADTVLTADVTLLTETLFPGELVISGKTRLGSDLVWKISGFQSREPDAPAVPSVNFTIAGLGDVEVLQPIGGVGNLSIRLADGREYDGSGSVEMLTGAIYTVGVEAAPVANYDPKTHINYVNPNSPGQIINPTYMTGGGDVSIAIAGNINGAGAIMEHMRWSTATGSTPVSALYGYNYPGKDPNAPFDSEPLPFQYDGTGQTSLSLLADNFKQGIGALGGGDITVTSGGDVDNLVVAIPTWVRVSGGRVAGEAKQVHYSGGGDLNMTVGQNLKGGYLHMGQGQAMVDVAGSVMATDQKVNVTGTRKDNQYLHIALDDAKFQLQAGGDIHLRSISPTQGVLDVNTLKIPNMPLWFGYTQNTAVRVTSLGGDITYHSANIGENGVPEYLPSKTAFVATAGSINLGTPKVASARLIFDMWPDTQIDMLAQQDIHFRTFGSYAGAGITIGWADPEWVNRAVNPGGYAADLFGRLPTQDPLTGQWVFNQAGPGFGINGANVHSGSSTYSRFYAAKGDLLGWNVDPNNPGDPVGLHSGTFTFGHETRLKAGGDIRMGEINFITHDGSDVSTMEAGGAIYLPNAILYGPGRLWVQAADEIYMGRTGGKGIRAREAISSVSTSAPLNGGSITALAGIDQAPEYAAFLDYYLDPKAIDAAPSWLRQYFVDGERGLSVSTDVVLKDGKTRTTVYAIELVNYMRAFKGQALIETEVPDEVSGSRPVTRGKLAAAIDPAEYAQALAEFRALDPVRQKPLAIRILNAELKTAGREAVGASPETDGRFVRNGDPRRGYDAIGRLFPGAQRRAGETLAEGEHSWTGSINMLVSQIRAESGGDIDLVVPGGAIQLASLSISNTDPSQAGIITQRGGSVSAITYGDYIVNQSRTMTADDGDILLWSSYGNIDAGRGRKTSLSVPPVAFPINAWGQTKIQLSGLPNGAGIASLDQVDGRQGGDVDLYAFNGIVNAGDAGIRASRDLFVGANEIRGLDNITVGGTSNLDLTTDEGSVGPLNVENFAQSAEDDALEKAFEMSKEIEKLRTVRQTILTGSVVSFGTEGQR